MTTLKFQHFRGRCISITTTTTTTVPPPPIPFENESQIDAVVLLFKRTQSSDVV